MAFSLLYASYTANIVSLLQSPSKNIRTMEDLYKSKIELYVEDTPYNRVYFSPSADNSPFQKKVIREKIDKKNRFIKDSEGVAKIRKGLNAFFGTTSIYRIIEDTFYEHEKCYLVDVEFVNYGYPYLAFKRNSPYREILRVK